MGTLTYSSNNSGGSWWLADDDWKNLEAAGWVVEWFTGTHARYADAEGRWLGALAAGATLETDDVEVAIEQFEIITGKDADAAGCNCCGQPHNFTFTDNKGETKYRYLETRSTGAWS